MNLQENIQRLKEMMDIPDMNILDEPLQICGKKRKTTGGWVKIPEVSNKSKPIKV